MEVLPMTLVDKCIGELVWVIMKDEREITGTLQGFDNFLSDSLFKLDMVLEDVKEYESKGKGGTLLSKRSSVLLNGSHIAMVNPCQTRSYRALSQTITEFKLMQKHSLLKFSAPSIHVRRIVPKESKILKYTPLKLDFDQNSMGSLSPPPPPNIFRINSPIFGVEDFSCLPRVQGFSLKTTPTNKTKALIKNRTFFTTAESTKKPRKNNYLHESKMGGAGIQARLQNSALYSNEREHSVSKNSNTLDLVPPSQFRLTCTPFSKLLETPQNEKVKVIRASGSISKLIEPDLNMDDCFAGQKNQKDISRIRRIVNRSNNSPKKNMIYMSPLENPDLASTCMGPLKRQLSKFRRASYSRESSQESKIFIKSVYKEYEESEPVDQASVKQEETQAPNSPREEEWGKLVETAQRDETFEKKAKKLNVCKSVESSISLYRTRFGGKMRRSMHELEVSGLRKMNEDRQSVLRFLDRV